MTRSAGLRVHDYLEHIVDAIANVTRYTAGMDREAFMADRRTQDAVVRNLEVIGEACNKIAKQDAAFANTHKDVPWGVAYEMRNALAHGYFKIDYEIVWQTIQSDLPQLEAAVSTALASLPPRSN